MKLKDDLIGYATVLAGPSEAEDILSTVVVGVLARGSLTQLDDPRPYLFRAILNEARGRQRRSRRLLPLLRRDEFTVAKHDEDVIHAVRRLPPRQRAAIFLVYWEDMTVADAAKAMDARPGTVKRYLHLARRTIRKVLT